MAADSEQQAFTKIPNALLEALARESITGGEWRVLIWLIRHTFGWHQEGVRVRIIKLSRDLGIDKAYAHRILKRLVERGIVVDSRVNKSAVKYRICCNPKRWKTLTPDSSALTRESTTVDAGVNALSILKETRERKEEIGGAVAPLSPSKPTLEELSQRYEPSLLRDTFEAFRSMSESGEVPESLLVRFLENCARYPADVVEAGLRAYLDEDHAAQGRDYHYCLGIIRNLAKRDLRAEEARAAPVETRKPYWLNGKPFRWWILEENEAYGRELERLEQRVAVAGEAT